MGSLRKRARRSIEQIVRKRKVQTIISFSGWIIAFLLIFVRSLNFSSAHVQLNPKLPGPHSDLDIPKFLFVILTSETTFDSAVTGFSSLLLGNHTCVTRLYTATEHDYLSCSARLRSYGTVHDSGCRFEVWYQKQIRMWGDIVLDNIPVETKVIFLRNGASVNNRAVAWFNLAHNRIRHFYWNGGPRDIAGMSVGCTGEKSLSSWWALRVGPLNNTCAFSPLRSEGEDVWDFFVSWFNARRREWLGWPHIWDSEMSVPVFWKGTKLNRDSRLVEFGMSVGKSYSFSKDPYEMWERWFPRFTSNYTMRVVTAETNLDIFTSNSIWTGFNKDKSIIKLQNTSDYSTATAYDDSVSVGDIWYEPVDAEFGTGYFNALKKIVGAKQKMVSVTMVSSVFLELTRSWLCNVKHGNMQPPNIYWITLDEESEQELSSIGIGTTVDVRDALVAHNMDPVHIYYGQPAYWKLMLLRTRLIRDLLDRGVNVFLFETDQVWLRDPFEYIQKEVSAGADLVGTLDTQHNIAGNTILLRPTFSTRRLWSEVYLRFKKSYDQREIEQKPIHSQTFVRHDQFQLSDLLLYNKEFIQDYPVTLGLLNSQKFVGGSWYMGNYQSEESKTPIIINNNFVSGTKKKKDRAVAFGHWFLKEDSTTCDLTAITKAMRFEFARLPGSWKYNVSST